MFFRALLAAVLLLTVAPPALAQSADQEVVGVVDSPDPIVPGNDLTYTVTMRNNGPDPATNGGLNMNIGGSMALVSTTPPPGFTCAAFGSSVSCTTPSFAVGTVTIVVRVHVDASLLNFADGTLTSNFFPSGTTSDPNSGNNAKSISTAYDSPQIDLAVAVTDAPDPVGPNQNITYTVMASNAGPDSATSVNFNTYNNGSLLFQSVSAPAGFSCTPPAVNAAPIFTCSAATVAPGNYPFTVVVRADSTVLGLNDGIVMTAFSLNGTGNDTNQANNTETESTNYVTPDANVSVVVGDTPDPQIVGGNIDYLVTLSNAGPDPAPSPRISTFNNGSLRFRSVLPPAGYSCTAVAAGATPNFTCTGGSPLAVGASVDFIVSVGTDVNSVGVNGGTVQMIYSAATTINDPDHSADSENEMTTLVRNDLFKDGFE